MSTGAVDRHEQNFDSPIVIVSLTLILLAFFIMGFCSLYFCKCVVHNLIYTYVFRHNPNTSPVNSEGPSPNRLGLDPKIIQKFPSFEYSSVKSYRREKYGLECAICLVEFSDDDILSLLPICSHVFHQECVDLWLEKHTTCPACRTNLDSLNIPTPTPTHRINQSGQSSPSPSLQNNATIQNQNDVLEGSFVSITIEDEKDTGISSITEKDNNGGGRGGVGEEEEEKFSRSNTTGHSSIFCSNCNNDINIGVDKFTLKLPENVKEEIFKGLNPSKSCTAF